MTTIKTTDVKVIDDLYPRSKLDTKKIQEYSDNTEVLPAIELNQDNILIDGAHRLSAFKQANIEEIPYIITETNSESELFLLALQRNAIHGLQLSQMDKKRHAIKLCGSADDGVIIKSLSISPRTYRDWTKGKKEQLDNERDANVIDLWLQCYTYSSIETMLGVPETTAKRIIEKVQNGKTAKMDFLKGFVPQLYNIWSFAKNNNDNDHFGNMPRDIVENLLYYYTEPFDVVFDPFGGGGTTLDVCRDWYRRYFVSDIMPTEIAQQKGVKQHDITTGQPEGLPKPKFVFLDPPYWKQAEKRYTELDNDFGNMTLPDFYTCFEVLFKQVYGKLVENGYMAFIIQNTQWKNEDKRTEPHSHKLWNIAESMGFHFENIIHVPYSTEQYNAQQVNYSKEHKLLLELNREIVVFKK